MARNVTRSRRGFGLGHRRISTWVLGPGGDDIASLDKTAFSTSTTAVIGSGVAPAGAPFTIVRIRGHLSVSLTTAAAAEGGFNWVAGIGIATEDAFTDIGVTALANPFDDTDWPGWLWQASGTIASQVGALAVGDPTENPVMVPVDSKAMRKIGINEVVFLSVQAGEAGTAVMSVAAYTRMLIKLA